MGDAPEFGFDDFALDASGPRPDNLASLPPFVFIPGFWTVGIVNSPAVIDEPPSLCKSAETATARPASTRFIPRFRVGEHLNMLVGKSRQGKAG
jgi:hypothetical protein